MRKLVQVTFDWPPLVEVVRGERMERWALYWEIVPEINQSGKTWAASLCPCHINFKKLYCSLQDVIRSPLLTAAPTLHPPLLSN